MTTTKCYAPSGRLIQRDYTSWYDYQYHDRSTPDPLPDAGVETFFTDLRRKVYGGGGICADVLVEPDELAFIQYLLARSAFFNFAVEGSTTARR
ncbi:MAG: hypothetical protein R2991_12000 [Thermoanaerobaculia bacterium]